MPKTMQKPTEPATVVLDDIHPDPIYCHVTLHGWNGFAVPYFPSKSVDVIIAQVNEYLRKHPEAAEVTITVSWDEIGGETVVRLDDPAYPEEGTEYVHPVLIDGNPHWPVGAAAWVWQRVD